MGENSKIQWTNHTWNPWMGCHKISRGCRFCYMFREQTFYGNDPNVVRRSKTKFNEPLKWKDPALVFTCSWSDWFIEEADEWREEAWEVIRRTPHLTYQILTKRPENIATRLPADWGNGWPNVWLGISAEDQKNADKRIPVLLNVMARVRFISAEPLLGPIDFIETAYSITNFGGRKIAGFTLSGLMHMIHWVIVGGESGPEARPMNLDWARGIRDQCRDAGVSVFVKQLGGWPDKRGDPETWPVDLRVREFPATSAVPTVKP